MGLLSWLRQRRRRAVAPVRLGEAPSVSAVQPVVVASGFVVVDVETTGLVASRDRIVEIAIVRTDAAGRIVDEWTTLVNPGGPVGASKIHGITAADVRSAPRFADIVGEVTARLAGRAVVAHNARFDLAFIETEFARAGWTLPAAPYLCTLEASSTYLPYLSRRRLSDCCWSCGIQLQDPHSALGDARATATLLASYLDPTLGRPPKDEHVSMPALAARIRWPAVPRVPTATKRRGASAAVEAPASPGTLWVLLDNLPLSTVMEEGAPAIATAYLELLIEVLEDGVLTDAEAQSLADVAKVFSLTRPQVEATHRAFLLALAHRIVEDGVVTREERNELLGAAKALGLGVELPAKVLDEALAALNETRGKGCEPLPVSWPYGEPLRVGEAVAFTGCDQLIRAHLEGRAQGAGLRVTGSVSRKTAVLVTDGANPNTTKAMSAREHGTRVVTPEVFAELVAYVQPGVQTSAKTVFAVPQRTPVGQAALDTFSPSLTPEDPGVIRAWARENGLAVGVRGRISSEVLAGYRAVRDASPGPRR